MSEGDVGFLFLHGAEAPNPKAILADSIPLPSAERVDDLFEQNGLIRSGRVVEFTNGTYRVNAIQNRTIGTASPKIAKLVACINANNFLPHAKRHAALLEMKSVPAPLVAETQSADAPSPRTMAKGLALAVERKLPGFPAKAVSVEGSERRKEIGVNHAANLH